MTAIEDAIRDVATWRPNAYVHTGDHGNNAGMNVREALRLERHSARPTLFVIGNHDEEEITGGAGNPNTAEIEGVHYFNEAAPFYGTATWHSGDGTLQARVIWLDCNLYDDDPDGDTPGDSANHEPGDRIGTSNSDPAGGGGFWRRFGAAQLQFVEETLASDSSSQIVLVFTHYPPGGISCTDFAALADILQADGRPTAGFCGHVHPDATSYTLTSTDEQASYTWYKMLATQESSCWCRVTLSLDGGAVAIDEAVLHNYTDPGSWTINAPFTVAE